MQPVLVAEIEPVRAKAAPLAEVPASALRIAAGFADASSDLFHAVWISPGPEDGQVLINAASPARAAEILCEGSCQRSVGLPVMALRAAIRRHRDAAHAVLVSADDQVSLRTYSRDCTVVLTMPEADGSLLPLPSAPAGEFTVTPLHFNPALLIETLRDMSAAGSLKITPFSIGWRMEGRCDEFEAVAIVAGLAA